VNQEQARALALGANLDQLRAMVVTLASGVAAADLYLGLKPELSGPESSIKVLVRAHVGKAMALIREQPAPALCGLSASRNRVCAAPAGHAGLHSFVFRTTRED
jgi:hypothetical protein